MFIFLFILLLVLLILVHEFGHFIVAKAFGIKVHEFGVFFPPRITAVKYGETEYSLNWLPFGGFVRIFGENYDEGKNDPRSFINKSRLKQALVIVAGVAFNILFAWAALTVGYMVGMPHPTHGDTTGLVKNAVTTVVGILPGSPADKAGLLSGDIVKKIQTGHEVFDISTLGTPPPGASHAQAATNFIIARPDESMVITVERMDREMVFLAKAQEGVVEGRKAIGIELDDIGTVKLSFPYALVKAAQVTWEWTSSITVGLLVFFKQIFTGAANFSEIAGPIGITVFGASILKEGFIAGVMLIAFISINLAVINLIPVPGLDGGRLLIIIIEGVRGKPISQGLMTKLTLAGFALLIVLMLAVSYHDIAKLIG